MTTTFKTLEGFAARCCKDIQNEIFASRGMEDTMRGVTPIKQLVYEKDPVHKSQVLLAETNDDYVFVYDCPVSKKHMFKRNNNLEALKKDVYIYLPNEDNRRKYIKNLVDKKASLEFEEILIDPHIGLPGYISTNCLVDLTNAFMDVGRHDIASVLYMLQAHRLNNSIIE